MDRQKPEAAIQVRRLSNTLRRGISIPTSQFLSPNVLFLSFRFALRPDGYDIRSHWSERLLRYS